MRLQNKQQLLQHALRHRIIIISVLFCSWAIAEYYFRQPYAAKGFELALAPFMDRVLSTFEGE